MIKTGRDIRFEKNLRLAYRFPDIRNRASSSGTAISRQTGGIITQGEGLNTGNAGLQLLPNAFKASRLTVVCRFYRNDFNIGANHFFTADSYNISKRNFQFRLNSDAVELIGFVGGNPYTVGNTFGAAYRNIPLVVGITHDGTTTTILGLSGGAFTTIYSGTGIGSPLDTTDAFIGIGCGWADSTTAYDNTARSVTMTHLLAWDSALPLAALRDVMLSPDLAIPGRKKFIPIPSAAGGATSQSAAIILPGKIRKQPTTPQRIDERILPGRSQVFLPSLGYHGVLYGGASGRDIVTLQNANGPFTQINKLGTVHIHRPNTTTSPGESYKWQTPDFDIGPNGSMFWIGYREFEGYPAALEYGGASWGLSISATSTTVTASYVDNPTTAQFDAAMTVSAIGVKEVIAIGLIKKGNTVTVVYRGNAVTATGGNGGIRRSAGSGFGMESAIGDAYKATYLSGITNAVLSVEGMQRILDDPWSIFQKRPRIISLPGAAAGGSAVSGTFTATDAIDVPALLGGVKVSGTLAVTDVIDIPAITGIVKVQGTFTPTDTADVFAANGSVSSAGVPTLSAATVTSIGTTSATPRVTLTFS